MVNICMPLSGAVKWLRNFGGYVAYLPRYLVHRLEYHQYPGHYGNHSRQLISILVELVSKIMNQFILINMSYSMTSPITFTFMWAPNR